MIYHPNEAIEKVAFVKNGYVRLYNFDLDGKEITYSGFKPIFLMSYLFAKNKAINQYYFEALTDLEIWKAPINEFDLFLNDNPPLALEVINSCLMSLKEVLMSWENSISGDAYKRVGKLLVALGRNYGSKNDGQVEINFKTTHHLIASMLGITRETASIQIKKLENDGWIIQTKNSIFINNPEEMIEEFI